MKNILINRLRSSKKNFVFFTVAFAIILCLILLNLYIGSIKIPIQEIGNILLGKSNSTVWHYIVVESRLPQALTATICGASLAICGLMLQTAFNNPLAGPSIFGINSGASLGVAIVILLLGGSITTSMLTVGGFFSIILGAFIGASLVIVILLIVSNFVKSSTALLIIGIMVGYLASAAISVLNFFATDQSITAYVMWGMGNFSSVSLEHLPVFAIFATLCILASMLLIKPLNALLLGERYAANLGFNTRKVRMWLLLMTGIQSAITTAYCGPVAFIGLAVPHITRILLHTDNHSVLMPATAFVGAITALLCNLACTLPSGGNVIPLNAVTPIIGAPVIIYVVIRHK